eukprot:c35600_g1_i1 orf=174-449(-)
MPLIGVTDAFSKRRFWIIWCYLVNPLGSNKLLCQHVSPLHELPPESPTEPVLQQGKNVLAYKGELSWGMEVRCKRLVQCMLLLKHHINPTC